MSKDTTFQITTPAGILLFRGISHADGSVTVTYRGDYEANYGNGNCYENFSSIDAVMKITPTASKVSYTKGVKN